MKQEEKKELKRQVILKAATACFENRRFDEVTLDQIAAEAEVGKGTLYLYFANKEDLFLQLAVQGVDDMVTQIEAWTERSDHPFAERFEHMALALADFFMRRHGFIRLMNQAVSEQINEGFRGHRKRMQNAVLAFIRQGVAEGALREDCGLVELEMLLVGPLVMRSRKQDEQKPIAPEGLVKLIWSGIKRDS